MAIDVTKLPPLQEVIQALVPVKWAVDIDIATVDLEIQVLPQNC
jgi:hypothetical protein